MDRINRVGRYKIRVTPVNPVCFCRSYHQIQPHFISNMYPKQGKMSAIKLSDASILDKLSVNPWIP